MTARQRTGRAEPDTLEACGVSAGQLSEIVLGLSRLKPGCGTVRVGPALLLGASMVFVGRPALYGASIGGQAGVARVLEIFRTEIDRNLALLGCADIQALDRSYLDPVKLRAFCG